MILGARTGEAASTLILGVDSRSRVKALRDGDSSGRVSSLPLSVH
jgi:hypothetical protein